VFTVLIVDDYEPWRRHVSAELEKYPRFRVVAEARDGLQGVRTAHTLAPDLILLDIGLPGLNGLEAARRILAQRRDARILMVTEQHSPDIAEAALEAGARGYLFKMDAGRDLLFAMEAIVNGGGFLSSALAPHLGHLLPVKRNAHRHEVGFFSDEASILDAYVEFAESGIRAGSPVIVVTDGHRRTHVLRRLEERGVPVAALVEERRCVPVDADDVLSRIMLNDRVDEARFREVIIPSLVDASGSSTSAPTRVVACGEMAPRLWKRGNAEAALQLERLWDGLVREFDVETFCCYAPVDVPRLGADDYAIMQQICDAHSAVHIR